MRGATATATRPTRLIRAVPLAPSDVPENIGALADERVCLHPPDDPQATGAFVRQFDLVDHDDVTAIHGRT